MSRFKRGEQPKEVHSPLDKDDKPELDESPLLGPDGIKRFQTLIGAAQWLITLSRFDIAHAIMSLGRFRPTPVRTEQCSSVSLGGFTANLTAKIFQLERSLLFLALKSRQEAQLQQQN